MYPTLSLPDTPAQCVSSQVLCFGWAIMDTEILEHLYAQKNTH